MITRMDEIRDKRRVLASEDKDLKDEFTALEFKVLDALDEQGTTMSRGTTASVSISEVEVPNAVDWDEIYDYIQEHNALYLFGRKISATAWRELKEAGVLIPGTEAFKKRSLNLRKLGNS